MQQAWGVGPHEVALHVQLTLGPKEGWILVPSILPQSYRYNFRLCCCWHHQKHRSMGVLEDVEEVYGSCDLYAILEVRTPLLLPHPPTLPPSSCRLLTISPLVTFQVERTATASQLRRAYYKQALKCHPDKSKAENRERASKVN